MAIILGMKQFFLDVGIISFISFSSKDSYSDKYLR